MSIFSSYQSPFSWRYASHEMRQIWSELNKRRLWRRLWVCLAQVEFEFGLVTQAQLADLQANADNVNLERSLEIEREICHDLMAEVKAFAEQCQIGGGIIHFGATSMDIKDNSEVLQVAEALDILLFKLSRLLITFADRITEFATLPCIAFTHLQPAEPTTLGYRFANTAQDLLEDWKTIKAFRKNLRGKGFKGAVGTSASYVELVGIDNLVRFENRLSELLGLPFFSVTTQTYPRSQDYHLLCALAGLGASLYKFAMDMRLLQAQPIGELSEPFAENQVGSSAMPFKRNPVKAEQIDSLTRILSQMPQIAWQNAANSLLERTLDDSANRRLLLPESFLICDEVVSATTDILLGFQVHSVVIQKNLETYSPFAATERLLMAFVRAGADRQQMHERLRQHSMATWESIREGCPNDLASRIISDTELLTFLSPQRISEVLEADGYVGLAPQRAMEMARNIHITLTDR
jgi:adenylosuccinate lyase